MVTSLYYNLVVSLNRAEKVTSWLKKFTARITFAYLFGTHFAFFSIDFFEYDCCSLIFLFLIVICH